MAIGIKQSKYEILAGIQEDCRSIIAVAKALKKYPVCEADIESMRGALESILFALDNELEIESPDDES